MYNSCTSVFKALSHGNIKNEKREKKNNRGKKSEERSASGKKCNGYEKEGPMTYSYYLGLPSHRVGYFMKQWMNYLPNLALHIQIIHCPHYGADNIHHVLLCRLNKYLL